jgi:predicted ArsR family transcriptional regulator
MGRDGAKKGPVEANSRKADDDIRMRILRFVKSRGTCTIGETAKRLRVTHEGARKQMAVLEANGWVAREAAQVADRNPATGRRRTGKRGRPVESYRVTTAGDRLFPKAYDRLSSDLIAGVAAAGGPAFMRQVIAALADLQVGAWKPLLEGLSAAERLERLKGLYLKDDPFMSVEKRDGDLILIERNCPFLNVAMEHPALCSLSVTTLERLLGHPVSREEKFQSGHGRCVFRIRLGENLRDGAFRLEGDKESEKEAEKQTRNGRTEPD